VRNPEGIVEKKTTLCLKRVALNDEYMNMWKFIYCGNFTTVGCKLPCKRPYKKPLQTQTNPYKILVKENRELGSMAAFVTTVNTSYKVY